MTKTGELLTALAITGLALALRLFELDTESYWYDESISLLAARKSVVEIAQYHITGVGQSYPPLYTYLLHLWGLLFGLTALSGRMFSALFGAGAVFLLFLLVRRLAGGPAGLLAAALFAVSEIGVVYSQETRAYSLVYAQAIGAALLLDVAARERRIEAWWGFCVLSSALALTHYHALWILLALWGFALAAPLLGLRTLPARWWITGLALCCVLVTPWFAGAGLHAVLEAREIRSGAQPFYFQADWLTLARVVGTYNNAGMAVLVSLPQIGGVALYSVPAALALLPALEALLRRRPLEPEHRAAILLGGAAALAMAGPVAIALTFDSIPYHRRYTSIGVGFYCGLVAIGAMQLRPLVYRRLAVAMMLVFALTAMRSTYLQPNKENWRDSLAWLAEDVRDDDVTVFMPFGTPPLTWQVYHPDREPPRHVALEDALARESSSGRVWLVAYGRLGIHAEAGREAAKQFEASGYELLEQREYPWLVVSLWKR